MDDAHLGVLALRCAMGDMDALEELLRGVHRPLFTFLHLLGIPPNDLEEVAQDVVVQMHRSIGRYSRNYAFLPWLRSIARHVTANYWRTHRAEERKIKAFQHYLESKVEEHAQDLPQGEVPPAVLDECMRKLQERHRELVTLRYHHGYDSARIAGALGLQAPAVRQSLARIRDILKTCVEKTVRLSSAT